MLILSLYLPGPGGKVRSSANLDYLPIFPHPDPLYLELK